MGVEDRQLPRLPEGRALGPRSDDGSGQHLSEEMSVESKGSEREPVGGFFAKVMIAVEEADDIGRPSAAGDEENVSCVESGEPAAEVRAQVGQIVNAAAELQDGGGGWHHWVHK